MASRRNELSAHTFSRRRTVAAFLRPAGGGNDEDAPRPLRAVVPGLVLSVVAVAAFGGYGLFRPTAPKNWESANAVIVGKQSTTRYVVLGGANGRTLHPVLNIASARLLLGTGSTVEDVADSVLDSGQIPHGATVGIPYAPDSLPTSKDAQIPKTWADCDRPGLGGVLTGSAEKLFVLGGSDASTVAGHGRLGADRALYVRGTAPDNTSYLVDSTGTRHALVPGTRGMSLLAAAAFGPTVGQPQQVTAQWLATLRAGSPISIPEDIPGYGTASAHPASGQLSRIGDLFQVSASGGPLDYVLLGDGIHRVSGFTDQLLRAIDPSRRVPTVPALSVPDANRLPPFQVGADWPTGPVTQANSSSVAADATVACSVFAGGTSATGLPQLGLWVGADYPLNSTSGSAGVYVTPGTGLLYRDVTGTSTTAGGVYLLTDTGLRYPVQGNSDSASEPAPAAQSAPEASGVSAPPPAAGGARPDSAQAALGYGSVSPKPVPDAWSSLLPLGPNLNRTAAAQQQGS